MQHTNDHCPQTQEGAYRDAVQHQRDGTGKHKVVPARRGLLFHGPTCLEWNDLALSVPHSSREAIGSLKIVDVARPSTAMPGQLEGR